MKLLEDNKQMIYAVKQLASREIKRKYARSYLGIVWSVLNPLLMMAVMSMVFSTMFRKTIENYPIYYMTGMILWSLFSDATDSAMSVLIDNKELMMKVRMPRQTFIYTKVISALLNLGYSLVAYVVLLVVFQIEFSWTMLLLPVPIIFLTLLSLGLAHVLSVLYVFFADVKYLYSVFLRLLMYLCALFYPVTSLPEQMQSIIGLNPVFVCINFARQCVMYQTVPDVMDWIKIVVWGVGMFAFGTWFFKHNENNIMQRM